MLLSSILLTLSLAGRGLSYNYKNGPQHQNSRRDAVAPPALPDTKRIILEFEAVCPPTHPVSLLVTDSVQGTNYDAALKEISARPGITVLKEFKSDIFSGVTIESETGETPEILQTISSVSTAWKSNLIKLMPTVQMTEFSDGLPATTNYSVHGMTGVDKLHDAGIFGKGAVVAIIDTGVEYTHPAVCCPILLLDLRPSH